MTDRTRFPFHRTLLGAAWFFIGATTINLIGSIADASMIGAYTAATPETAAVGDALAQLVIVLGATIATLTKDTLLRRGGHLVLLGWAALWLGDTSLSAGLNPDVGSLLTTMLVSLFTAGTGYRCVRGWSVKHKNRLEDDCIGAPAESHDLDANDDQLLTAECVKATASVTELPTDTRDRLRQWMHDHCPVQARKDAARAAKASPVSRCHRMRHLVCRCKRKATERSRRARAKLADRIAPTTV
ncbi:MAG: hypothetical protein AAF432_15040 [Planctomycetota bacterium]